MSRKEQFVVERNWQTQQLCMLVGMLNLLGDIIIEKPMKFRTKALVFFRVLSVEIEGKQFNIKELTEKRIDELCYRDACSQVSDITRKRRKDVYKIMEHLHVLMDIVINETRFELITSNAKHNSLDDKRTLKVVKIDSLSISKNEMKVIGAELHNAIYDELISDHIKTTLCLTRGNTQIMSILVDDHLYYKAERLLIEKKLRKEQAKQLSQQEMK